MRISKKNAARIRAGVHKGNNTVIRSRTGMVHFTPALDSELESRAYFRTTTAELNRLARKALILATELTG